MYKPTFFALAAFSLFTLTACSEPAKEQPKAPPQSTGEVMQQYTDTLAAAKDKAEEAKRLADANRAEVERNIKEMDGK